MNFNVELHEESKDIEAGLSLGVFPEDVYRHVIELCNEAVAVATSVRDDADAGKFNGAPGKTPEAGVDYFTEADKQAIAVAAAQKVGFPKPTSADNGTYLGCENGKARWKTVDVPTGGVQFTTDETLSLKDGVLSVKTAQEPEPDNTLPITSAAVYTAVGNIEIILQTI